MKKIETTLLQKRPWIFEKVLQKGCSRNFNYDVDVEKLKELSKDGIIVYLITGKGLIDYWIINDFLTKKGLPKLYFSSGIDSFFFMNKVNFVKRKMKFLFKNHKNRTKYRDLIRWCLRHNKSFLINILDNEKKKLFSPPESELAIKEVMKLSKILDKKIYFVHLDMFWKKQRKKEGNKIVNFLLGNSQKPNFIKKFLYIHGPYRKGVLQSLKIREINEYVASKEEKDIDKLAKMFRREIILDNIANEKVTLGADYQSSKFVIDSLLQDKEVANIVKKLAKRQKTDEKTLYTRARSILKEMVAEYHFSMVEFFLWALNWLWNKIYDGLSFSKEDSEKVKHLVKTSKCIFIPSHKSYIDFLSLSYLLAINNTVPPHIAASDDFNFFPLNIFFRRGGAFFIKRNARGDLLYGFLLKKYVEFLLVNNFNIEFFIEGTRSRTGKLYFPKFGFVSMIIDLVKKKKVSNVCFIPLSISFDQLFELGTFKQEWEGKEKVKESTKGLFRSRKLLKRNYGKVYFKVSDPIYVEEELSKNKQKISDKNFVQKVSYKIFNSINQSATITVNSILSLIMLSEHQEKSIEEIKDKAGKLKAYFQKKDLIFSDVLKQDFDKAIEAGVENLVHNKTASEKRNGYIIKKGKRIFANYYKNNIIHFVLEQMLIKLAITYCIHNNKPHFFSLWRGITFLSKVLRYEFFFPETKEFRENIFNELYRLFDEEKLNKLFNGEISLIDFKTSLTDEVFCVSQDGILNFLEAYKFCAMFIKKSIDSKHTEFISDDFYKKCAHFAKSFKFSKTIITPESVFVPSYKNCINYLKDINIVKIEINQDNKEVIILNSETVSMNNLNHYIDKLNNYIEISKTSGIISK